MQRAVLRRDAGETVDEAQPGPRVGRFASPGSQAPEFVPGIEHAYSKVGSSSDSAA